MMVISTLGSLQNAKTVKQQSIFETINGKKQKEALSSN